MIVLLIETGFSLGLFINALLFLPQIIKLYKTKNSKSFSLLTFGGFCVIQLFVILHGIIHRDYLLAIFTGLSFLMCGVLVGMILFYRGDVRKTQG